MPLGSLDRLRHGHRKPDGDRADLLAQPGPGRARRRHRHSLGRRSGNGARLRGGSGQYRDRPVARSDIGWPRRCGRRWKADASLGSPAEFQSGVSQNRRARNSVSSGPDRRPPARAAGRPYGVAARVLGMIFAVPLHDDNPTIRSPIVTYLLIGMSTGRFLWQLGHNERVILYTFGMIPAELFGLWRPPQDLSGPGAMAEDSDQHVPAWGLVSFARQHAVSVDIRKQCRRRTGTRPLSVTLLACGIVAALAQAISNPASHIPMVGASGAIAGVLGAPTFCFIRAPMCIALSGS